MSSEPNLYLPGDVRDLDNRTQGRRGIMEEGLPTETGSGCLTPLRVHAACRWACVPGPPEQGGRVRGSWDLTRQRGGPGPGQWAPSRQPPAGERLWMAILRVLLEALPETQHSGPSLGAGVANWARTSARSGVGSGRGGMGRRG